MSELRFPHHRVGLFIVTHEERSENRVAEVTPYWSSEIRKLCVPVFKNGFAATQKRGCRYAPASAFSFQYSLTPKTSKPEFRPVSLFCVGL